VLRVIADGQLEMASKLCQWACDGSGDPPVYWMAELDIDAAAPTKSLKATKAFNRPHKRRFGK